VHEPTVDKSHIKGVNMSFFDQYRARLCEVLEGLEVTDRGGAAIETEWAFDEISRMTSMVQQHNRCMYFAGNGASAAMAGHMALDFAKNGRVRAHCFNDSAAVTALGNDLGYDHIFDQPIRWHGRAGDMLAVITSSGSSRNVLNAVEVARDLDLSVITFTGLNADNPCRQLGDLNFYIDAKSYGIVECAHQVLLHGWLDCFLGHAEWVMSHAQNMRIAD
jgi:D-sedoheptulose 7-phosphate isomerase